MRPRPPTEPCVRATYTALRSSLACARGLLSVSSPSHHPPDPTTLRSRRRCGRRPPVADEPRHSYSVVPFPRWLRGYALHHDWPPVSRCRNGTMRPSDSLYRVGRASLTLEHVLPRRSASARGGHNRVPRGQPRPSGRYRASLGKPCGLHANPHRTTAGSNRKSGIPITSKVTPPGQPLVSLSLRSAFRTPVLPRSSSGIDWSGFVLDSRPIDSGFSPALLE